MSSTPAVSTAQTADALGAQPEAPKDCPLCPRLVAFRKANQTTHPNWFNGAVPSFIPHDGERSVKLLIIGLAPGLQGANKTGRPFTGDYAGDLLYSTLTHFGLANNRYAARADDGFALRNTMITNAIRCVPPENKPTGAEANACRPFLVSRLESLPSLKVMICLGKISHDNTLRALGLKLSAHRFGHGTEYEVEGPNGPLTLLSSYHCSRYNTNTGRLTEEMFHDVFERTMELL
ncbi:MAG: uracil-DNA glycosylase [Pseudomonadota bacterium]